MSRDFCGSLKPSKTTAQVRAIFGLARKRGFDEADLHALVEEATATRNGKGGKQSIRDLNVTEADKVIVRLGGQPLAARRTVQERRRKAGVQQVVGQGQLDYIASLASQRQWGAETLQQFCLKLCKHFPLRTTRDANKVIEALKAMNKREGLWI